MKCLLSCKLSLNSKDGVKNVRYSFADVLTYHVVSGTYFSAGLTSGAVPTVEGKSVNIVVGQGGN